jgi:hypothetical protein
MLLSVCNGMALQYAAIACAIDRRNPPMAQAMQRDGAVRAMVYAYLYE